MSIQQKQAHQSHEAVVFFADGDVSKEMLYTEFEALLDCVVPMRDFCGRELEAAYIRFDDYLNILGVVLFLIPFTEDGFPDERWNVPLRQLADAGTRGPDLGGGPIRLATRSQCPQRGDETMLWDIRFEAHGNTLARLQERLRMNRLGVDVAEQANPLRAQAASWQPQATAPAAAPAPQYAAPPAAAPAGQGEALMGYMQQSAEQMAALREQHQRDLHGMQEQLATVQRAHAALQNEALALRQQVARHAEEQDAAKQAAELKLQQLIEKARAQLGAQKREADAALADAAAAHAVAMAAAEAGHTEALQAAAAQAAHERQLLEIEIQNLSAELTELRRDKRRLLGAGADKFFDSLKEKGVKFVSFQPGAGHLTIPMDEIYQFIEDTETFVARKCNVSVESYRRWLAHYNNPVCQGTAGNGGPCAKPVSKLLKPAEFTTGVHDRCEIHKQAPRVRPAGSAG